MDERPVIKSVIDPDRPFARRMAGGPDRIREQLAAER